MLLDMACFLNDYFLDICLDCHLYSTHVTLLFCQYSSTQSHFDPVVTAQYSGRLGLVR